MKKENKIKDKRTVFQIFADWASGNRNKKFEIRYSKTAMVIRVMGNKRKIK